MNLYLFHVRGFLRPLSQLCGIPNFLSFSLSLSLSRFLFLSLSLFSSPRVTRSNIKISTVRSILVLQPREVAASVRVATFMKGNTSQKVNDVDPCARSVLAAVRPLFTYNFYYPRYTSRERDKCT